MTTDEMIEVMALAIVNREQERLDLPRIASVSDFHREADAVEYLANARAALAAILPVLREVVLPEVAPSDQAIDEAFKAVSYKYFGDYELSEDQWDAVWTMHAAAGRVKSIRARFDQIAKEIEG